jgi:ferrous iron transport protein A
MQIPLSALKVGQFGNVVGFTDELTSLKLLEMGLLPGEHIQLERWAPLGCPVLINLSSSQLSLRKEEADMVLVQTDNNA